MRTKTAAGALTLAALLGPGAFASAHPRGALAPENAVQLRLGGFFPRGGGELWDENEAVFTLDTEDLRDFAAGLSVVHAVNNNLEVGVNLDFHNGSVISEYRDYVDGAGFGIFHDTDLSIVPLTVDLRVVPGGRYRIRGPGGRRSLKPVVFYVGGGIGASLWEYEELGDFLDFTPDPPEIFPARFEDSGTAFEAHVLAGVELSLTPTLNLLIEGRHSAADDELEGDFAGLGRIELGGTSVYGGLAFRF